MLLKNTIKEKLLLFIVISLPIITSCSTSKTVNIRTDNLIGTWDLIEFDEYKGSKDYFSETYITFSELEDKAPKNNDEYNYNYLLSGKVANRFNAPTYLESNGVIKISDKMISTRMAAFPRNRAILERLFFKKLQEVKSYSIKKDKLTLNYDEDKKISFRRHNHTH